ncbi:MAG: insulinase family protein [Deltaproteobacteria bacterium]|nr:insulinase family protein [Deltaproteobacteria bacterium]
MKPANSILLLKTVLLAGLFAASTQCRADTGVDFEEDFSLPVAYINIVVDAGATNDPDSKLGLANVASRMLLRGTQKHAKLEFNELLNRLGGEFDLDVRDEGTVFAGAVLSENMEKFLTLVDEALSKPKFTAQELAKLKKETEGEILERKGNDKALLQYNHYRYLYGAHPYGHPLIGTQKGVRSINYKDILNYYAQHFSGRTMRLFGTGAVKKEVVQKWFTALTEKLNALHPEAKPVESLAVPAIASGRRTLLVDKPASTQAQVLMGGTGMRPEMPGFYAITLGNQPFGGHSFQARMMREIRVKRGWTYGASNAFRFGRQPKHYEQCPVQLRHLEEALGKRHDGIPHGFSARLLP